MAALPQGVKLLVAGFGDTPEPSVQRDEMDRGPINQELLNSRVLWKMQATLLMETKAAQAAFDNFWRNEVGIIGWFDLVHPRTGQLLSVRFVGGKIGTATMIAPGWRAASRAVELEYYA